MDESYADNEEHTFSFNFDPSTSQCKFFFVVLIVAKPSLLVLGSCQQVSPLPAHLDLLAQAHCLVSSPPRETSPPSAKRSRATNGDPNKDYHTCQICGTRVKAPRGGRWNLQMHVMAMHSSFRPYKCRSCDFQDYR
ncbi:unnamed protein product [Strongylus vulgaris]|uniref:C2H2-type domain-containing protein n=1 Tax=Strongylus vulgaris TaxID=40348 RepID=A0A3P7JED9_STRVU|nr:unnamed protein product [Strongylus vulgaris]